MPIEILDCEHERSKFPGGEIHVKVNICGIRHVRAFLQSSDDIMELMLLADAMERMGQKILRLTIIYFPYARQDRVCNPGEALGASVMARLINSLNIEEVYVIDPHSDVTPALINNCNYYAINDIIYGDIMENKVIVCPDAGAEKRILKLKRPYVMATKLRDPETGDIISTKVYADDSEINGKDCLIIDDICDGGRTFIELAKVLKAKGAKTVELYVTYGIFSKGMDVFEGIIDKIHTFESFYKLPEKE